MAHKLRACGSGWGLGSLGVNSSSLVNCKGRPGRDRGHHSVCYSCPSLSGHLVFTCAVSTDVWSVRVAGAWISAGYIHSGMKGPRQLYPLSPLTLQFRRMALSPLL